MSQGLETDLKQLVLSNASFGPREIDQLVGAIREDFSNYRTIRDGVQELESREDHSPASNVRLGVCYFLLGRYSKAVRALSAGDGGALAQFYLARSYLAQAQFDEAINCYEAAGRAGYDADACALGRAEALRSAERPEEALKTLDQLSGAVEETAEYLYQRAATISALGGNPSEVAALLERAVANNPQHAGALFGLAKENDRYGNDREALALYERSAAQFPPHVGTLLNLGLLYEDDNQYEKAQKCYRRVLDVYPNHPRAHLYLKDASASSREYFDEDAQRRRDRLSQVLAIPVTDFELSVRSRNCLHKMGLMTLGDLAETTEQELLASKNFGETSLIEIREMLTAKGLELGQFADERRQPEIVYEEDTLSPDEQALLSRPIADLNLSVRARKCMIRLGVSTVGDLLRRTGDDLLECKNFGVTSLNEVREKLTIHGLKLRGD